MTVRAAGALLALGALVLGARSAGAVSADALRAVEDESTLELVTTGRRSGQERTVTIWFVRDGERLYVQSGKEGQTDWYRNVLANPAVTLRIGTLRLRGEAHGIDDAAETERVHTLFDQKYLRARVMGWFGGGFGHGKVVVIDHLDQLEGGAPSPPAAGSG